MAKNKILNVINSPEDIKKLSLDDLKVLSREVSSLIKETVEENGGHYSSPLGFNSLVK